LITAAAGTVEPNPELNVFLRVVAYTQRRQWAGEGEGCGAEHCVGISVSAPVRYAMPARDHILAL
jgi:hypothetical protein